MSRHILRTVNAIVTIPGVGDVHTNFAITIAPGATYRATRAFEIQLEDRIKQILNEMAGEQAMLAKYQEWKEAV